MITYSEISTKIEAKAYNPTAPAVCVKRKSPITNEQLMAFMQTEGKDLTLAQATELVLKRQQTEYDTSLAAQTLYREQSATGMAAFWDDVAECYNITNNPIRPFIEAMAWDQGHAYGFSNILCVYSNLMDNLAEFINKYNFVPKA